MNKKISIITVNFNNLEGLKKTVSSVINQTWQEFEYIVIDGASTDGSAAYLESQSDKIDYWTSEPDKGIYNAMNKGIRIAKGEYVLFLNSGDNLNSLNALEENHIYLADKDIIYFDINVEENGNFYVKKCPEVMNFAYLYHDTLPHQSTFIRKILFEKIGYYDENIRIVSDWKFFILALIKHNASYKHIDSVFSTFYLGGISSQESYFNDRNQVLDEYFKEFERLMELEIFLKNIKISKSIKLLQKLGLLKFIDKIN